MLYQPKLNTPVYGVTGLRGERGCMIHPSVNTGNNRQVRPSRVTRVPGRLYIYLYIYITIYKCAYIYAVRPSRVEAMRPCNLVSLQTAEEPRSRGAKEPRSGGAAGAPPEFAASGHGIADFPVSNWGGNCWQSGTGKVVIIFFVF